MTLWQAFAIHPKPDGLSIDISDVGIRASKIQIQPKKHRIWIRIHTSLIEMHAIETKVILDVQDVVCGCSKTLSM